MDSDLKSIEKVNEFGIYYPPPDDRRCTATSKQSHERCKRWCKPGWNVCHYHGANGGPRTPEALENSRNARLKHGAYISEEIRLKLYKRITETAEKQLFTLKYSLGYIEKRLEVMTAREFRQYRRHFKEYYTGKVTMDALLEILDGKTNN